MAQYEDIKQKINQGLTDRQIAKAVGKRRSKISAIRKVSNPSSSDRHDAGKSHESGPV